MLIIKEMMPNRRFTSAVNVADGGGRSSGTSSNKSTTTTSTKTTSSGCSGVNKSSYSSGCSGSNTAYYNCVAQYNSIIESCNTKIAALEKEKTQYSNVKSSLSSQMSSVTGSISQMKSTGTKVTDVGFIGGQSIDSDSAIDGVVQGLETFINVLKR